MLKKLLFLCPLLLMKIESRASEPPIPLQNLNFILTNAVNKNKKNNHGSISQELFVVLKYGNDYFKMVLDLQKKAAAEQEITPPQTASSKDETVRKASCCVAQMATYLKSREQQACACAANMQKFLTQEIDKQNSANKTSTASAGLPPRHKSVPTTPPWVTRMVARVNVSGPTTKRSSSVSLPRSKKKDDETSFQALGSIPTAELSQQSDHSQKNNPTSKQNSPKLTPGRQRTKYKELHVDVSYDSDDTLEEALASHKDDSSDDDDDNDLSSPSATLRVDAAFSPERASASRSGLATEDSVSHHYADDKNDESNPDQPS